MSAIYDGSQSSPQNLSENEASIDMLQTGSISHELDMQRLSSVLDNDTNSVSLWDPLRTSLLQAGWSEIFINHGVLEMKRFLMLKSLSKDYDAKILSPSHFLDEVWHYLLMFNKQYNDLCYQLNANDLSDSKTSVLDIVIGHYPLVISESERQSRLRKTLSYYEEIFHENPRLNNIWNDSWDCSYAMQSRAPDRNYCQEANSKIFINITVQNFTIGKKNVLQVPPDGLVEDVKQKIYIEDGIHPKQQHLIYSGVQLEEGRPLCDYNIKDNCTLFLILKLRGC